MSFIKGLNNFLSGKPVFDGSESKNSSDIGSGSDGSKIIPKIVIEKFEVINRNNNFILDLFLKNYSKVEIFVDKVVIFGKTVEIDIQLKPNEIREVTSVYNGPKLINNNFKYCEVYYRY